MFPYIIQEKKDYERDPLEPNTEDLIKSIGPEISVIPVTKQKPQVKIKTYSRSPRNEIRLVSKFEAERTCNTYTKRKSSPLEKCPICKKYFRRMKTHLLKHDSIARDVNDPFTCSICTKVFNTQSNLQIHFRSHTGDKPYVCDVCHKAFSQSCNLVNHTRIHTG